MVWSGSEDGGDFVAQRIVVQPAVDETAEEATDEAAETADAESAIAAVTDA